MGDHLEIERKFEVDDDFERPDFTALPGVSAADPVTYHLAAVYYDTPDTRLAAAKITLRRRTGGTDEGWHLKLPAGTDERREVHAPLSTSGEVPERLAAQVAEVADGAPLGPIAALDTERTIVTLSVNDSPVAEVADDVVTARRLTGPEQAMRWREIEVEVPERSPGLQEAAARLLFAAGARPAGKASKLARLLDG
jgi:inorganic triphosphatase YgiF